jgi:hypothetical protein
MEDEYHRWYNEQHLPDVLRVPGVVAAQRFAALPGEDGSRDPYLAIYELDCDNPQEVVAALTAAMGTDRMVMSDALDLASIKITFYDPVSARQVAEEG